MTTLTMNEKFARESADKIFDELLESDGFHTEEDIPRKFMEDTMSDDVHANAIKLAIRKLILEDLKQCPPNAYARDENNNPIYDADMRGDYEGVAIDYICDIYMSTKTKTIYVCTHCNSDNVEIKVWVRPNKNFQYVDEVNEGDELGWCEDCQLHAVVETTEVKANAKVIGFQVVGEDGTPQEGEIHPKMGASFCVYCLQQANEMLHDCENNDEQWRLLTIWEGDVEEPTMMFEGNPRD